MYDAVYGLGVYGVGFGVQGRRCEFRVAGCLGVGLRDQGLGVRVEYGEVLGLGLRVG